MKEILRKVDTRHSITEADFNLVQSTLEKYPWFSLAHQFMARAAFQKNHNDLNHILNLASLYSSNREKLFDFVTSISETKVESVSKPTPIKESILPQKPEITSGESLIKEVSETVSKTVIISEPEVSEKEKDEEVSKETVEPQPDNNLKDNDIHFEIEVSEPSIQIVEQETPEPIKPLSDENGKEITSREQLRETVRRELQRIEEERKKSLSFSKDQSQQAANAQILTPSTEQKDKTKILEDFIKNKPSIQPPADGPYDETLRLAKESLEEHYDFVSETLAEIYFKQSNPEKAKKIYEQLILKLPEKKLYFAARIKEIEDNSKI